MNIKPTSRVKIVEALVSLLKTINGTGVFKSNLYESVEGRLKFWDEVNTYPFVSVVAGPEEREYLPGCFKWGHLLVRIRIYTNSEDPQTELENILSDIEYLLDNNLDLEYDSGKKATDTRILSIITDEGLLHPIGVGEMTIKVQYEVL